LRPRRVRPGRHESDPAGARERLHEWYPGDAAGWAAAGERGSPGRASTGGAGCPARRVPLRERRGSGDGHPARASRAGVRALLHDQARRRGYGARPRGRARHRRGARGMDRGRERCGQGEPLLDLPSPAGRADGGRVVSGRILVVDDEQSMCEALAAGLAPRGFSVRWETSAEAGLATLETTEADVVLTDLNMRGMDGLALCERIVANRPDLPVVVITAFGSLETAIAAIRAGAYDFITKPVKMDALAVAL